MLGINFECRLAGDYSPVLMSEQTPIATSGDSAQQPAWPCRPGTASAATPMKPSVVTALLGIALAFTCASNRLCAQPYAARLGRTAADGRDLGPNRSALRVDVALVLVPVTVTDSRDYPVTDLPMSCFKIYENDVSMNVVSLQRLDGPVSVGFIVDTSRSMTNKMGPSITAINQFLATSVPGDEYFLMRFNTDSSMVVGFTGNPELISAAIPGLQPDGLTALNDAIYRGVQAMRSAKNGRKALFVLTDGADNRSRYSDSEVRRLVRESDVRLYSIGLFTRPDFLTKLGSETGGSAFWVRTLTELPSAVEKLSRELRNEYLLGYSPRNSVADGKYHRVRVVVAQQTERAPLHVTWRRGYYAPEHLAHGMRTGRDPEWAASTKE